MNTPSISRRKFAQLLSLGAATAVVRPALATVQPAKNKETVALSSAQDGIIRLSSNENSYGPSGKAVEAMNESYHLCCRYPDERNDLLIDGLAKLNNVEHAQILLGDGSSEILKLCAETFTNPNARLVAPDPTFEALLEFAKNSGAEVVKVPLRTDNHAHDLEKMGAAAQKGLIYVCNPNNPTASITPKAALRDFINSTPADTMILVDEAYFHYADSPDYESVIPLVKDHANLIVARTFSKIYGMAGLRCGYGLAQKETIARMKKQQCWDSVNCMALAAAHASLSDPQQVLNGRKLNTDAKSFVVAELGELGYSTIPSQANFIMFDCKRPVVPLIQALKERKVQVGRLFPAMPNHMRLTIGKKSEMDAFLSAFKGVAA
jgi:histidinol-phosphate aminotransferase